MTWFSKRRVENFSLPGEIQYESIQREGKIYSATGESRVPFVSVDDVAQLAFRALDSKHLSSTEHVIMGPQLLSYDEVATVLSRVIGKSIVHVKLEERELTEKLQSSGIPLEDASMLASMDTMIKSGAEEKMYQAGENLTVASITFKDFATQARIIWNHD